MARAVSNSQHSSTQISDVNSTLEYGHVHRLARQVLIGALFALAVALVLLMSLDGRPAAGKQLLPRRRRDGCLAGLDRRCDTAAHAAELSEHRHFAERHSAA